MLVSPLLWCSCTYFCSISLSLISGSLYFIFLTCKLRFICMLTNRHPTTQTCPRPRLLCHHHSTKRKERQFYQNYRSFMEKDYENESALCVFGQQLENLGSPFKSWADNRKTGQPSRATGLGFPKPSLFPPVVSETADPWTPAGAKVRPPDGQAVLRTGRISSPRAIVRPCWGSGCPWRSAAADRRAA